MSEREKAVLINKAVKECLSIKHLLNQQEGEHFDPRDIIIEVSKKYNIPFNIIDRIVNWARRDNELLSNFIKVKDIVSQTTISFENLKKLANDNFTTILLINGVSYVRKTLMPLIIEMNEKNLYYTNKYTK